MPPLKPWLLSGEWAKNIECEQSVFKCDFSIRSYSDTKKKKTSCDTVWTRIWYKFQDIDFCFVFYALFWWWKSLTLHVFHITGHTTEKKTLKRCLWFELTMFFFLNFALCLLFIWTSILVSPSEIILMCHTKSKLRARVTPEHSMNSYRTAIW